MKRRTFLRQGIAIGAIAFGVRNKGLLAKYSVKKTPLSTNPLRIPPVISGGDLTITQTTFKIFPDTDTNILSINNIGGTSAFPAPTIRLKKGDTFSATITNKLTEPTVIHWHGIHAPADKDGHPKNAIAPDGTVGISYKIIQRAGTYFYHSHADMSTARQSYMGMMGCFIISDDEEQALNLPSGEFDIPLLIQDKVFDANKQLLYAPTDADMQTGWLGDDILINGTPNASLSVAQNLYRFRLINGSNARIYNIGLSDGKTFTVIGNDGGLLEKPASLISAMLAPAERLDIIIDFSSYSIGSSVTLESLSFPSDGTPSSHGSAQGTKMDLLQFTIDKVKSFSGTIPASLSPIIKYDPADVKGKPRTFELQENHYINLQSFAMDRIDGKPVPFGDLEQWSFINESQLTHPMHVHGTQFQILDRSGNPPEIYEMGWKDTVRVDPSQTVNVLIRFAEGTEYTGTYLVHCHNLEHEDMGMMSNFQVEKLGSVEEKKSATDRIEIYPNPASEYALLNFSFLEKDTALTLSDEKGAIILNEMLPLGMTQYAIIASRLANGKYSIVLGRQKGNLIVVR